jgi:hypothetical protein
MSKVKIQGNASGTGVVTLTAPNTNTDRTITLPDGDISLGVGIDDNATSTAITIDANKNVTVGMGSAGIMEVRHSGGYGGLRIAGGAGGSAAMLLLSNNYSATVEDKWSINLDGYTDDLTFFSGGTPAVGTERVRFLDSGGITFNGDTAAANALDDYEEGTWTPTLTGETSGSLDCVDSGKYTKIGNTVHISVYVNQSLNTSILNGNIKISNLPFSTNNWHGGGTITYSNLLTNINEETTSIGVRPIGDGFRLTKGAAANWVTRADLYSGTSTIYFMLQATYQAA